MIDLQTDTFKSNSFRLIREALMKKRKDEDDNEATSKMDKKVHCNSGPNVISV